MKVLFKLLWILLIAGILEACNASGRLEYALECAATNKGELEKVLEHYKDEPEKYKAACFLIENMPYHYALEGEELDSLKTVLASADAYGVMLKDTAVPDWDYYTPSGLQRKPDVLNIRAEFLINNIDLAFDGWKKRPWNASLSFADFCEWLLPYRIGNETPDNWRQIYHDRYSFLLDEVYTGIDVVEAISVVWEYLQKEDPYRFTWVFNYPHLGGEYLLHNRIGKCQDACDFMIYVMRAIGVPVAYDFYTFNAETRKGHVWNVVRDVTGVCLPFTFPSRKPKRGSFYIDSRRPSVVYRRCFGRQWDMDGDFMRNRSVPAAFKDVFARKVSDNYFDSNLELPVEGMDGNYVYVGLFSAYGWRGIDFTKVESGKALFRGLGDSKSPLIFVAVACVVNIVGDLVLVAGFKMDAAGAAIATVAAQAVSVGFAIVLLVKKQLVKITGDDFKVNEHCVRALKVGAPLALQECLTQISFLALCAFVNRLGLTASSGYGVACKIVNFAMLVPSSLMQSMASFVSQNVGAGKEKRAKKAMFTGMGVGLVVGCVVFLRLLCIWGVSPGLFFPISAMILR